MARQSSMLFLVLLSCVAIVYGSDCTDMTSIDSSCATYLATKSIANLAFTTGDWNSKGFETYVIQDGYYLQSYKAAVVDHMNSLCAGKLPPQLLTDISNRLAPSPFDPAAYNAALGVDMGSQKPSALLTAYLSHYSKQNTCPDMLQAMQPCLCIYAPIIKTIVANAQKDGKQLPPAAQRWVDYNWSSGTACSLVQTAAGMLKASNFDPYNQSMRNELAFFAQSPPGSEL